MRRQVVIVLSFLLALAACGQKEASKLFEGPNADYGKSLFSDLQAKNIDALREKMDPKVLATASADVFDKMADYFPQTAPLSVDVVGLNTTEFPGNKDVARQVNVSLQYSYDGKWLLATAVWRENAAGEKVILGMHVQPLAMSLKDANSFHLAGKSFKHYAVLAAAVAMAAFSIAVLIICIRTPMSRKRKALWCIGIIFGFGQISLNWATGAISMTPLHFQLLSAGWFRIGLVGPHMIFVSLPLFALLFLWRRHQGKFSSGRTVEDESSSFDIRDR